MNVSWRKRLWFSASLTTIILMGFSAPAMCENPSAGVVLELTKDDRQSLAILGEGVVGKALSAVPLHDIGRLMPLREDETDYRITAGAHKGTRQQAAISKAKGKKERNLWQRTIAGDATEFFSVDGSGAINLVSERDLKQNVITRYRPMFPIMSDGMKPGETSRVETAVSVYALHDPTDLKYKGRLKVTHTYVGAFEVTVPAGTYETVLIRSSYEGKVGPADVTDGGYAFYAKDVGIVASLERMHVTAFLFYDKRTKTPKVLVK
ncbi:MAG: hypothetical protein K9N10_21035 [Deltaproteobacteria bacterium]|nr:hypothetical protein [Deltaproteobacteria bacterium]